MSQKSKKSSLGRKFVADLFDSDSYLFDRSQFLGLLREMFNIKTKWKNNLYIDIPFCEQRCLYCAYFRGIPSGTNSVKRFTRDVLLPQIGLFSEVFRRREFYQVQFGGGTPTLIAPSIMEGIFRSIPNFDRIPVKIIEVSPYSFTDDYIDLLSAHDFTNISIGVQTFSSPRLRKQNRPPINKSRIRRFCRRIEQSGMISNIDLMFFMDGADTDMSAERKDLEYALSVLRPVEIVVHCKYGVVSNNKGLHEPLTNLIREMLKKYPEYICVNSSLKKSDMQDDPCIRLMRDRFDYLMSFQAVRVHPANFGYNTLALGDALDSSPLYSSFFKYLILHNKYHSARVVNWDWSSDRYGEFIRVRKRQNLPYHSFNQNEFFVNKKDEKKVDSIAARLQSLMVLDKYLCKRILAPHAYKIVNIIRYDDSCREIEFARDGHDDNFLLSIHREKPDIPCQKTGSGHYISYDHTSMNRTQLDFINELTASV